MVLVAPAAALGATVLSTNGTPVPATSWSTTHADSKPKSSTCRAAAPMSPNDSSRRLIVGRKTPIAGGAICGPFDEHDVTIEDVQCGRNRRARLSAQQPPTACVFPPELQRS